MPCHAAELAAYQPGAVVSRTILRTDAGSITAFAFDGEQALSEHTAPHEALVQILEGVAEIRIAETPHRLDAGQVLRLPAGVPHAVRALERFKMLLVMLRA